MVPFPSILHLLGRLSWKVSYIAYLFSRFNFSTRVLLCCIRFLSNWPCPHCLVHKSEIQDLGTKQDINRQETKRHADDDRWHMLVETAQDMIYVDGVWPGSDAISKLLASQVAMPTWVSTSVKLHILATWCLIFLCRMHFLNVFRNMDSTFIRCLLSICCTSSNLASGRQFSLTSICSGR